MPKSDPISARDIAAEVRSYTDGELHQYIGRYERQLADLRAAGPQGDARDWADRVVEMNGMLGAMTEERRLRQPERPLSMPGPWVSAGGSSSAARPFSSIGEQFQAIAMSERPGARVDERLHQIRAAASGLGETVPSDGGFLLQQEYNNELLQGVAAGGILAPRCRLIPIGANANSVKLNMYDETSRVSTRFGGAQGYWLDEAAEKIASKPKFRQVTLELKKLVGLCYASDELLADVTLLGRVVTEAITAELQFKLDDAILRGTGAGMPLGVLNAGCLVTVSKETGQAADTVVSENIWKMYARLLSGANSAPVWLVNRNVLPQLFQLSISVGTGGSAIFQPAGGISQSPYNSLLGFPVLPCEQCSALGDLGDIVLADLSGYLLATKGGIEAATSIHVRFVYDESIFRFVLRVDGQPERASALTPYKGSDSLSHFVALEAR